MSLVRDFPDLPPVWMLGHGFAAWAASRVVPVLSFEGPTARFLGGLAVGAGIALSVWAAYWFLRERTTIEPRERPTALIFEGPFRLNRNPIYTGMALVLLGFALWLGTLAALAVVALFPVVIDRRFVPGEEAMLRESFGDSAAAYIASTRRW